MNDEDADLVLPAGWVVTTLGQILRDIQPGFASGKHTSDGDGLPHLRPMNVTREGNIDRSDLRSVAPELADKASRRLRRGDVLFNNTNSLELVGKTALFEGEDEPAFSNHMTRLRVNEEAVDPGFVARLLHGRWQNGEFQRLANNHVSQASVGRAVLAELPIALPPLDEQRRIAAHLDKIHDHQATAAGHLQMARALVDRLRGAVLAAASTGRLTGDWREEHPEPQDAQSTRERIRLKTRTKPRSRATGRPDETVLPELPDSWVWASLGEVAEVQLGGTPSRKRPDYWDGDVPWVSSGEVANCRIVTTRERITSGGLDNSSAKLYPVGTVLIAMIGEGKTRGQAAILDIAASTNQNSAGVIVDRDVLDPEYVWRWARAQYETTRAVGRGGNQPALNGQKVRELVLPVPPLAEQHEIVRRADALLTNADGLAGRIDRAALTLERASQSALANAFRGELAPIEAL